MYPAARISTLFRSGLGRGGKGEKELMDTGTKQ